jgi:hypothetical protein
VAEARGQPVPGRSKAANLYCFLSRKSVNSVTVAGPLMPIADQLSPQR